MRYGVGDITHSSGHHDHFNQWMWQRLLWSPRTDVENVVNEYCRAWFGPEAAPEMAKALFIFEENMVEQTGNQIDKKTDIDEYYTLVKQAGEKMLKWQMKNSWLWRMYMQKGAIDKYTKLSVIQQKELQTRIEKLISSGKTDNQSINEALKWLSEMSETAEMAALRVEAEKLGAESNQLFGMNSEGVSNLKHDFVGLGWLKRQLERSLAASGVERNELLAMITDYENPGEGGFYDNLGTFNPAPHIESGYPYDHGQPYVSQMLSEGNRPSQRSMNYTQDEKQGVTLHYRDLDPDDSYKIRFTFVRPWYQERYNMRMKQHSQSVYADNKLLAKDVELPLQMSDFFTYDIPAEATADGDLVIRLEKAADVAAGDRVSVEQWRNSGGWGTIVSEVWLMKK
jgi:ribosomal protein S16